MSEKLAPKVEKVDKFSIYVAVFLLGYATCAVVNRVTELKGQLHNEETILQSQGYVIP